MKVEFTIDKKYDMEMAKSMGFPKKMILNAKKRYKTSGKYLILTKKIYQNCWNEINDEFSKYID